jgi:catechol 2,3-dioxygenase-like lactoylglutathione lyase family enzyme
VQPTTTPVDRPPTGGQPGPRPVGAVILIALGVAFLVANMLPAAVRGGVVLLGLGLAFLLGRLLTGRYGLAVPAGILLALGALAALDPAGAPREQPTNVPGAAHLCFDVPDIQAAYQELRARGVRFRSAPVEITSAANRGARGVYLSDPDGITLELRQPPAG